MHWRLHTRPSTSSTSIWVLTLVHSHVDRWWLADLTHTQVKWQSWSSSQDEAQLQTAMFCWYTAYIITIPSQPCHVNYHSWLPSQRALRWCQVAQTNLWQVSHGRQDRLQFACHVHGRMQWHDVWHSCWWFKKSLDDTECFPLAKCNVSEHVSQYVWCSSSRQHCVCCMNLMTKSCGGLSLHLADCELIAFSTLSNMQNCAWKVEQSAVLEVELHTSDHNDHWKKKQ